MPPVWAKIVRLLFLSDIEPIRVCFFCRDEGHDAVQRRVAGKTKYIQSRTLMEKAVRVGYY